MNTEQSTELNLTDGDTDELDTTTEQPEGEAEGTPAPDRGDELPTPKSETPPEPTPGAKPEGEQEPDDDGMPSTIPYGRFKEVNDTLKDEREARIRLEERLRLIEEAQGRGKPEQQEQQEQAPAVDLKELRRQRSEAIIDGDVDKIAELDEQIENELEARAVARASAQFEATRAEEAFKGVVKSSYEQYPFLDNKSASANAEAIGEVVVWRDHYYANGASLAESLRMAVERVGPRYAGEKVSTPTPPAATTDAEQRRREILARNASMNQPPPTSQAGAGQRGASDKLNINELTEQEFEALPEKEKARLRGDFV